MAGIDKNELYRIKKEVEEYNNQQYNKTSVLKDKLDKIINKLTSKYDSELTEELKLEIISLLHESRNIVIDSHANYAIKLGKMW